MIQGAAILAGLVCVLFFALFASYYFRNRSQTLGLRRRGDDPEGAKTLTPEAGDDDGL